MKVVEAVASVILECDPLGCQSEEKDAAILIGALNEIGFLVVPMEPTSEIMFRLADEIFGFQQHGERELATAKRAWASAIKASQ
jgi:hypothetical protein